METPNPEVLTNPGEAPASGESVDSTDVLNSVENEALMSVEPLRLSSESKPDRAPAFGQDWFIARDIARALGVGWHNKKVHRVAEREHWPARMVNNRLEYQPPRSVARIVLAEPKTAREDARPTVKFGDLVSGDEQREIVLWRKEAVELLGNNLHLGKECALSLVTKHFKKERPLFRISESSLRRWRMDFERFGLDGLVEQKRGKVGRKAYALDLQPEHLLKAAAGAVEAGIKGRLNIARSYRENLVANPTLQGAARAWCHGDTASKSSVPPSVREAIRGLASPLTTKLLQVGPKAAKLAGPYTECSYENVPAGHAFTADDMTANVYVWVEWPNEDGFLLIRPQLLACMDVGSMAWLNIRVVMRPKGQYNKDDVWGLIGDTLDKFGIFKLAVLEGGTWQSDVVIGQRTGLSDKERFGGLESLGVKVIHTRTPHGKIIETAFNSLQHAMDNVRGYCGRMEMKDCPENVKAELAKCRSGKAHPREFFMHVSEFTKHVETVMRNLNSERNDGKILRGETPWDKWATRAEMEQVPDSAKWMYRSAYNVVRVTRNGVRISQRTGRNQIFYSYSNTALEVHRGRRVICFWNDSDPDTDAVIYSVRDGRAHQFLCVAKRIPDVPRFGASEQQWEAEATRKKLSHQMAVTQSASLAPYLQRGINAKAQRGEDAKGEGESIRARLDAAREAAASRKTEAAKVQRAVRGVEVSAEDMDAVMGESESEFNRREQRERRGEVSAEEISEMLGD